MFGLDLFVETHRRDPSSRPIIDHCSKTPRRLPDSKVYHAVILHTIRSSKATSQQIKHAQKRWWRVLKSEIMSLLFLVIFFFTSILLLSFSLACYVTNRFIGLTFRCWFVVIGRWLCTLCHIFLLFFIGIMEQFNKRKRISCTFVCAGFHFVKWVCECGGYVTEFDCFWKKWEVMANTDNTLRNDHSLNIRII